MTKQWTHSIECISRRAAWALEVHEYIIRWPNYCRKCRGWGGHMDSYDPSPAGVSLSAGRMYEFEPCPDCMDAFRCPRCGRQALVENIDDTTVEIDDPEEARCLNCGWRMESGGLPEEVECWCEPEYGILDEHIDG